VFQEIDPWSTNLRTVDFAKFACTIKIESLKTAEQNIRSRGVHDSFRESVKSRSVYRVRGDTRRHGVLGKYRLSPGWRSAVFLFSTLAGEAAKPQLVIFGTIKK
jgi:hypothetical protein